MTTTAFEVMNQEFVKLDRFDGHEGSRPNANPKEIMKVAKLKKKSEEDNFTCQGQILNTSSDRLYDLYMLMQSPVEIWEVLEEKDNTERQCTNKFLMMKYFEFRMLNSIPIIDQVHELKVLSGLSSRSCLCLETIHRHLRIEEETRKRDAVYISQNSKVNHVSESKNPQNGKQKAISETKDVQDKKKSYNCYNCNKKGHHIKDCKLLKKMQDGATSKANMSLEIGMIAELNIIIVDKSYNWWLDFRATFHVLANREVLMSNYQSVTVLGQGMVERNSHLGRN
ncbi:hypothetical protein V6Z11_A04G090300 [Gossypium hirsutum]